ncbi:hypothetical protein B0J12DRAFT_336550 [Macrophomina phaseolina]|uniref:Uncharacterized protein n=1 Tax=Macrophomina phaseolina TaxID=35725 RepID=A0ABQ8GLH4_9PEZI|nr:hypothetical protein B0J12DRAFT_336550 [Macrophomina phaseolina]
MMLEAAADVSFHAVCPGPFASPQARISHAGSAEPGAGASEHCRSGPASQAKPNAAAPRIRPPQQGACVLPKPASRLLSSSAPRSIQSPADLPHCPRPNTRFRQPARPCLTNCAQPTRVLTAIRTVTNRPPTASASAAPSSSSSSPSSAAAAAATQHQAGMPVPSAEPPP